MSQSPNADREVFRLPRGPALLIGLTMCVPVVLLLRRPADIVICLTLVGVMLAIGGFAGVMAVSRNGVVLYRVNSASWADFTTARVRRVLGLPYLYATRRRGLPWW